MNWTRRVMRCAVLRTSPGDDVIAPLAHTLCRFGCWFTSHASAFSELDAGKAREIEHVHRTMHDAIRSICKDILGGDPGQAADLDAFEQTQSELIGLMAWFKTQFLARAMRCDPLTGLPLRYGIEHEFIQVQKKCKRDHTQLYVVMIDVDHFKRVNDDFGHAVGDRALRHLADTLKSIIRPNEPLFRFGGEEFLLLMQCHSSEAAAAAAQRIVNRVRNVPMVLSETDSVVLTVTLGVAAAQLDGVMEDALARADRALYAGKESGRNRYVLSED